MSEHTPTPWRFEANAYGTWFIYETAKSRSTPMGFQISELICGGDGYRTLTEANAAFIVKAANSYGALEKALAIIDGELKFYQEERDRGNLTDLGLHSHNVLLGIRRRIGDDVGSQPGPAVVDK